MTGRRIERKLPNKILRLSNGADHIPVIINSWFIGRFGSSAAPSSDVVRDLNNFLQHVQKPNNLTKYLHHSSEQVGPNNMCTYQVTYTCQSVSYSLLDSTH